MKTLHKRYAAVVAYSPSIGRDKVDNEIEKFKTVVAELSGKVEKQEYLGLKGLAYEIKKCNTAHYVQYYFKLQKDKNTKHYVSEINRKIGSKINQNTIRHMIMLVDHNDFYFNSLKNFEKFDDNIKI